MTDDLTGDLRQHIYQAHASGPRANSHWVMSPEWLSELRRIDSSPGRLYEPGLTVSAPEFLLGIPIDVRADGGVPHLEEVA